MESHQITFATGCSGIGAPEMAWGERLGWKPLWCSEIEPFPCAVLKHHWPETPNAGDFLTVAERINSDELEAPDVFIAGTGGNNVPLCYTGEAELKFGFVRRLTTVECARLQGFPDHHTEIPWRRKPSEKCPRAPQYKAYGNSMCVNVIEWLGRCIEEELNHPEPFEIFYPEQQTFNF